MKLSKKALHAQLFQFVYGHLDEASCWRYTFMEILAIFLLPIASLGFCGVKIFHLEHHDYSNLHEGFSLLFLALALLLLFSVSLYFTASIVAFLLTPVGILSSLAFFFMAAWVFTMDHWWPRLEKLLCPKIDWED